MRRRALLLFGATLLAASPGKANETAEQPSSLRQTLPNVAPREVGLPLEHVLAEIARVSGVSFVFDSRIVSAKRVNPVNAGLPVQKALKAELRKADLDLRRVGRKTYAIVEARRPVRLASVAEAPAFAAASPVGMDTIVVTASVASTLVSAGSQHLFVIDEDMLRHLQASAPAEIVYALPQSLASVTSASTARYGSLEGLNLADLRGLGPARTKVLLNGRRRTPTPGGNGLIAAVDLNAFSEPFLERIEVLDRPHGARLGPDAVAGAANFVTRKQIDGLQIGARGVATQRGNGEEASAYVMGGGRFADDRGEIAAGVSVARFDGIRGGERHTTARAHGFARDGKRVADVTAPFLPGYGGSPSTPRGAVSGVVLNSGARGPLPDASYYTLTGDGGFEPYEGLPHQLYNALADQHIVIPLDHAIGFVNAELALGGDAVLFTEGNFAFTRSDVELAALPMTMTQGGDPLVADAILVPLDAPTVPQALRDFVAAAHGTSAQSLIIERRFVEVGPRRQINDRLYADAVIGLRLQRASGATIEAAYRYGSAHVHVEEMNRVDKQRLAIALDPATCAAVAGCTPVNLFVDGGVSAAAADFVRAAPASRELSIVEHELSVSASGEFQGPLPEEASLSASFDLRRETLRFSGLLHTESIAGMFEHASARGARTVYEAAGTATLPIIRAAAPFTEIDISTSLRLTASSTSRLARNVEGAVDWRPFDGLRLFTRQSLGERPPNIAELFSVDPGIGAPFVDPCAAAAPSPTVAENCASQGLAGLQQTLGSVLSTAYGNRNAEPEDIRSAVYGFSLSPAEFLPDLPGRMLTTVSWLDYRIDNMLYIPAPSPSLCYESEGFSHPTCGVNSVTGALQIRRDEATGQIIAIDRMLANGGGRRWRGLDLELLYAFEPAGLGPIDRVRISALHTVAVEVRRIDPDTGAESVREGLLNDPRHRSMVSASVDIGPASLGVFLQRRGKARSSELDIDAARIPAVTTADIALGYVLSDRISATIGVKNLTDRDAPIFPFADVADTAPQYYDIRGRRYAFGVSASF